LVTVVTTVVADWTTTDVEKEVRVTVPSVTETVDVTVLAGVVVAMVEVTTGMDR
jgi:hypothetical protein